MSDYIARDAVEKAISVLIPSMSTPDGTGYRDELILAAQEMCVDIIKAIQNIPSVDVAPVVYGRWEWFDEYVGAPIDGRDREWGWCCSNCKKELIDDYDNPCESPKIKYCSECGAKMD